MSKREKCPDDDDDQSLKPFTIISGEPKKIDCYLHDGSLKLYWAKTKDDVIAHLLRTNDTELQSIPLDRDSGYSHTPSDHHLVLCSDESCPCSKYVMCYACKETKEALPKEGIKVKYDGYEEELTTSETPACCQCETPDFRGLNRIQLICNAIDDYCDSDHCFKLIELAVQDPIKSEEHYDGSSEQ
jgi:hypothetical protein